MDLQTNYIISHLKNDVYSLRKDNFRLIRDNYELIDLNHRHHIYFRIFILISLLFNILIFISSYVKLHV